MLLGACDNRAVHVANINDRDSFIVVYLRNGVLKAKRVLPNGAASVNPITISTSVGNTGPSGWDVGGDITTTDNDAIVVWADSNDDIRVAQIEDSPSRGFQVFGEKVIGTGRCLDPAIAESGGTGSTSRYLVVWGLDFGSGDQVIRGVVIDRNLAVLDSLVQVTPSGGAYEYGSGVDGDGLQWVVVYTRVLNGDSDVMCRSVQFHPARPTGTAIGPEMVIEADPRDIEFLPSVAWLGDSALVSYADFNSGQEDIYCKTVEPFTCTICETQLTLDVSPERALVVSCASTRSGGANDDRALIVWDNLGSFGSGPIRAQRFLADDGIATDLGGGCGNGGTNYATCARAGHAAFRFQVREGLNGNGVLFLGFERIDANCGPCRLVPDPSTGVMVSITTSSAGRAELAVPIPNTPTVRGTVLYSQWFLFQNGAPCVTLPGHMSNALQVVVQ